MNNNNLKKMNELVKILNTYAEMYYDKDAPVVSDAEYDKLYDELLSLERETQTIHPNSPTLRVGGKLTDGFKPHTHIGRLWSLDKCKTYDDLKKWDIRLKKLLNKNDITYSLEYKFDGLTINLTYDNGKLVQAATRGNGVTGEGILQQAKTISSIPLVIDHKGTIEVQGEGIMHLSTLKKYNENAVEPLKNARNASAGALRNLDPKVTKSRHLDCYLYQVGYTSELNNKTHGEMIEFLKSQSFKVNDYFKKCTDINEVINEIELAAKNRNNLDYLIDGMVIKVWDYEQRITLGYTHRFPRWAIAFKFEAEEVTTKILDITWQVGRTGRITPVAELDSVDIGGVTVKRATLNNYDDIKRKNVKIGARALVRRSNDVIPEVMGVVDECGLKVEVLKNCPACGEKVDFIGAHLYCTNSLACPPQVIHRLRHFASRDAMDIETFNSKTAEVIFKHLDMKTIAGLYSIKKEDLLKLEGFKEKKANNLINALEKSKNIELSRFIYALGIPNVGVKTSKDLADEYKSLDNLKNTTIEKLINITDIGDIVAQSIVSFFEDEHNIKIIKQILEAGVNPQHIKKQQSKIFEGLTFVITGTLESLSRKEAGALVETNGGKVSSSVSTKTSYVLAGENAGSKLTKAQELDVTVIDLEGLMEMINK